MAVLGTPTQALGEQLHRTRAHEFARLMHAGESGSGPQRQCRVVIADDRELSGYGDDGRRTWKRSLGGKVAFTNERVSILPTADGIEVLETDLSIGSFGTRLRLEGSMKFIGVHAARAGELVFFATDERKVWAVDTARFEIVQRHSVDANHLLPPITTSAGVHVAAVSDRTTTVLTLDRTLGTIVSSHVLPGAAHTMTAGANGLVIDTMGQLQLPAQRIAFRPEAPGHELVITREPRHVPRIDRPLPVVEPRRIEKTADGRHVVIVPGRGITNEPARSGLLAMLDLLGAQSHVIPRLVEHGDVLTMSSIGLALRDPRLRTGNTAGRDPCLLPLGQLWNGDMICAYFYPPAASRTVRVARVAGTSVVEWLSEDFDRWFAGFLYTANKPSAAREAVKKLGLPADFIRPLTREIPPAWFALAHGPRFTLEDAQLAYESGDLEGAERMLVAARTGAPLLAEIYKRLDWPHQRAVVAETW